MQQKKVDNMQLNEAILDIIYSHTPYKKYDIFFMIWCVLSFAIGITIAILLNPTSMLDFVSIFKILFIGFAFGLVLPVVLILMAAMSIDILINEINEKAFDLEQLNKAIKTIQNRGFYEQFITEPLFNPITHPNSVITYADVDKMIKEQKIMANEIVMKDQNIKDRKIFNQQKTIVNKYK